MSRCPRCGYSAETIGSVTLSSLLKIPIDVWQQQADRLLLSRHVVNRARNACECAQWNGRPFAVRDISKLKNCGEQSQRLIRGMAIAALLEAERKTEPLYNKRDGT